MNIFINTLGSRGDVQPYVALGKGLQAAGHTVTLCTSCSFESFITEHGLHYGYMNDELIKIVNSDEGRDAMENMTNLWDGIRIARKLWKHVAPLQRMMLKDSWDSAQQANPDLIIFHPKAYGGPHFAEKLNIPVMLAVPMPLYVPTTEFPNIGFPNWKLGGWYNKLTYTLIQKLAVFWGGKYIKEWRRAQHLPPQPRGIDFLHTSAGEHIPVLHCYSRHVAPEPNDWPDNVAATGYWFLDHLDEWHPPTELLDFLAAGDPPIYVGFGSMAGRNPNRLAYIVIEALQQAKMRGVIATGWGGLAARDLPDTIFKIDKAPHDWLFPRMAAVVHHGGAGTTAAGLRAGRPTIICPFFGDQLFWGRRVCTLGVGSEPIPQKKLTVEKLAATIREVTSNPTIRQNAEVIGKKIQQEDGIANAVAIIERMV